MTAPFSQHLSGRCRGFTLVELMVALVVGLVVMMGIGQVFINSKRTAALQEEMAKIQEGGRLALHLMGEDIARAGYLGCGHTANLEGNIASSGGYADDFAVALNGHEAMHGGWVPPLPPELDDAGGEVESVMPGTDVLTVRFAEGEGVRLLQPKQPYFFTVRNISMESGGCGAGGESYSGLCAGDRVIVSDCSKARTFIIQSLQLSGDHLTLYHDIPPWGGPGDTDPNAHFSPAYSALFKAVTVSYFVRATGEEDTVVPALFRKMGEAPAEALIEGVENLQILYGVDTDEDGIPNRFLDAAAVPDFRDVVSVRVALLVRSIEERLNRAPAARSFTLLKSEITTPADRHLRKVFDTVIQLRNGG